MRYLVPLVALAFSIGFAPVSLLAAEENPAAASSKPSPHPDQIHDLKIGDAAPDFSLPGIDGKTHTLADYKDAKILIVAFVSNHCPDSHAAQPRIEKLLHDFKDKGVALVGINPNNPDGLSTDELGYSKYNDSFDDMKKYAADTKMSFPYLYDGVSQDVARAYGCLATPHLFIFDAERKLRYKGQLDDSQYPEEATVKKTPARDALEAMLAGKPVAVEVTKPHGCSTKWISRKAGIAAETKAKQFLEKNGAGLPDNLKASLKAEGRATYNYQFTASSTEDLMKALDPDWPGGIPHTILVAPDGSAQGLYSLTEAFTRVCQSMKVAH